MGCKILIVDDEAAIRCLIRSAIAIPGFEVFQADCGDRALDIARAEGAFALVITDILMPGMDGFDLADELSRLGHAARFLFISGYCDSETAAARMSPFEDAAFLDKPFSIAQLLQAVRGLLAPAEAAHIELRRHA